MPPKKKSEEPAALRLRNCSSKVRVFDGEKVVHAKCDGQWVGDKQCPKKDQHLLPMKSGWCAQGWCEGTKATDWRGRPAPTCKMIGQCPCICHDMLTKMFAMTGAERLVIESSGYAPPHRTYWLPEDDPLPALDRSSNGLVGTGPAIIESPAPDIVPATVTRDFRPTESGRTPKGQLELWVKEQCDIWLIDKPGFPCTPQWLSDHIAEDQGITPPSVGAISAVFDRWTNLGFAVIERKPTRFIKYTDEGIRLGLERMKQDAKRKTRLQVADDRRNLRRP